MAIIEDMPDEIADDVLNVQVHGPGFDGRWIVQGPFYGDVPGEDEIVPSCIVEDRDTALTVATELAAETAVIYADPDPS